MSDSFAVTKVYRSTKQLFRYGLVGIASNLSGFLLFLLITYWGVEPKKAMTLLYVVGATIGFFGNRHWAFAYTGPLLGAGVRYLIAHVFGYLINFFILLALVDGLGYSHRWIQAAAIFVVAGFLFLAFKFFVFSEADRDARDA